jgi:hypothetical protein
VKYATGTRIQLSPKAPQALRLLFTTGTVLGNLNGKYIVRFDGGIIATAMTASDLAPVAS